MPTPKQWERVLTSMRERRKRSTPEELRAFLEKANPPVDDDQLREQPKAKAHKK